MLIQKKLYCLMGGVATTCNVQFGIRNSLATPAICTSKRKFSFASIRANAKSNLKVRRSIQIVSFFCNFDLFPLCQHYFTT